MLVCVALAILVSDQSSNLIKHFIHRLRPCAVGEARLLVDHCSNTFSFTSNHAANHFALAIFLSMVYKDKGKWLSFALVFWALAISLSQVYVGLHYPADILGGAILGSLVGYAAFLLFNFGKQKYFASSKVYDVLHEFNT
jgi:membrane-associated phospholipid phosphatase